MKPTVERLTERFTQLIGPEAFAKAEAAIAAAKAAAEAAAKAAAEKAAAAAAAAKAAAEKAAAEKAAAPAAPAGTPAVAAVAPKPVASPAAPAPASATPAAAVAAKPAAPAAPAVARPAPATPAATPGAVTAPRPAVAPRPAAVPGAAAPRPAVAAAPAAPAAPAVPPPVLPVQAVSHAAKGYDFDAIVAPDQVVKAAELLDADGFGLDTITGVDWIAQNEMEVVYDFFHPTEQIRVVVRARVPRATPELPTISQVFPGANWHERETHDFFGIRFLGHPNLKPFLLPEDADFHPLRKDYKP